MTPLMLAVKHRDDGNKKAIIQNLLQNGADVNAIKDGLTASEMTTDKDIQRFIRTHGSSEGNKTRGSRSPHKKGKKTPGGRKLKRTGTMRKRSN
jgi:hypothetical protein